jgi:hypothetical protein
MDTYSIPLALVDFLPNITFLIGAFFLVKIARICSGKRVGWMMMAGGLLVFLGGFTKALWKFMVAANIANIVWLSQLQFILASFGFLATCVTTIYIVRRRKTLAKGGIMLALAPWKIPFMFIMTLTSLGTEGILAYLAFQRNLKVAGAAFAVGVMGLLAMGALASAEQTITMQWIEEIINTIGQSGFMVGCILLHQNFKTHGC